MQSLWASKDVKDILLRTTSCQRIWHFKSFEICTFIRLTQDEMDNMQGTTSTKETGLVVKNIP